MKFLFCTGFTIILSACSVNNHMVGKGASDRRAESARQWYLLAGLIPLNKVDTQAMSSGSTDYAIKTEQGFLDILITALTAGIVASRTVTITK